MRSPRPALVALALAALAVPQAFYALREPVLPRDVALEVLPVGYNYGDDGGRLVAFFQLGNSRRDVTVLDIGVSLPGLRLVDVVASGEVFGFRSAGDGPAELPAFELARGEVVVMTLVYELEACSAIPSDPRPVPVLVRARGAEGTVSATLPQLPSDEPDARPQDLVEWQQVLARSGCR